MMIIIIIIMMMTIIVMMLIMLEMDGFMSLYSSHHYHDHLFTLSGKVDDKSEVPDG